MSDRYFLKYECAKVETAEPVSKGALTLVPSMFNTFSAGLPESPGGSKFYFLTGPCDALFLKASTGTS